MLLFESQLKIWLELEGFEDIYKINFPPTRTAETEILIAREGSGLLEKYLTIDYPRMRVEVRANYPETSYLKILELINKMNRLSNVTVGTVDVMWAELSGGPSFIIDGKTGQQSHLAYIIFMVKE